MSSEKKLYVSKAACRGILSRATKGKGESVQVLVVQLEVKPVPCNPVQPCGYPQLEGATETG